MTVIVRRGTAIAVSLSSTFYPNKASITDCQCQIDETAVKKISGFLE